MAGVFSPKWCNILSINSPVQKVLSTMLYVNQSLAAGAGLRLKSRPCTRPIAVAAGEPKATIADARRGWQLLLLLLLLRAAAGDDATGAAACCGRGWFRGGFVVVLLRAAAGDKTAGG